MINLQVFDIKHNNLVCDEDFKDLIKMLTEREVSNSLNPTSIYNLLTFISSPSQVISGDSSKDYHTHAELKADQAGESWKELAREVCVGDNTIQQQKPSPRKEVDTNETVKDSDYDPDDEYDNYDSDESNSGEEDESTVDDQNVKEDANTLQNGVNTIKHISGLVFGGKLMLRRLR